MTIDFGDKNIAVSIGSRNICFQKKNYKFIYLFLTTFSYANNDFFNNKNNLQPVDIIYLHEKHKKRLSTIKNLYFFIIIKLI